MSKLITAAIALLALTGCGTEYTYEAEPEGGNRSNPREISCFMVEADSSQGDEGDIALGRFCADEGRNDLGVTEEGDN